MTAPTDGAPIPPALAGRVRALGAPRLALVGDFVLDRYVAGEVGRISPEAPIPIFEERTAEERLGGAGNVAANLAAMGARVACVGVVGGDPLGETILERLRAIGAESAGVVRDAGRFTPLKTRLLAGAQQVLRVDRERIVPLEGKVLERVVEAARSAIAACEVAILSDYGKGVLVEPVLRAVFDAARAAGVRVLVDPKARDFRRYRGAHLVTPNRAEAERASGVPIGGREDLERAARALLEAAALEAIVVTLGKDGVYYRTREGEARVIPTQARAVFDVTGAGDTVIAHLGLFLAAGAPLEEAVRIANAAAGIVVGKLGAASVSREELLAQLEGPGRSDGKVVRDGAELARRLAAWRTEGRRIVFTNGCFDLLHAGHVSLLAAARNLGDLLVVGVNADASVRRLKGKGRPVLPLEDRLAILAALEAVDAVVPFEEDTPLALVETVRPDVLVKGEDWRGAGVVGAEAVEAGGGRVVFAELKPGRSTTDLLRTIAARFASRGEEAPRGSGGKARSGGRRG